MLCSSTWLMASCLSWRQWSSCPFSPSNFFSGGGVVVDDGLDVVAARVAAAGGDHESLEGRPEDAKGVEFGCIVLDGHESLFEAPEARDEVEDEEVAFGDDVEDRRELVHVFQEGVVAGGEPLGLGVEGGMAGVDDLGDLPLKPGDDELGVERLLRPPPGVVGLDVLREGQELLAAIREGQQRLQRRRPRQRRLFFFVLLGKAVPTLEVDVGKGEVGESFDGHPLGAGREAPAAVDDPVRQAADEPVEEEGVLRHRAVRAQLVHLPPEVGAQLRKLPLLPDQRLELLERHLVLRHLLREVRRRRVQRDPVRRRRRVLVPVPTV
mmetsp:Transcript_15264/g.49880  ORF Transcript_15264/g.49880 Transcript_15264/m.49880 type:complete len:323 (-) Transcript_15264:1196-2164(-)